MLENILVVDFPSGGLPAAWGISHMEAGNLIPCPVDIRNQVPLCDLLVVDVVDDLAAGASDSFANLVGLRNFRQE